MRTKIGSLLEELDQILPEKENLRLVESKGDHIIASAVNFIRMIHETFDQEQAIDLEKRFFAAIRNDDFKRFERGLKKIKESK